MIGNSGMTGSLGSVPIIIQPHADTFIRSQVRFPRSKKKRMAKKWRGDPCNWKSVLDPSYFEFNGSIVIGPKSFEVLREALCYER